MILETLYRPFYYIFTYLLIQSVVRSGWVQSFFPERSKKRQTPFARRGPDDLPVDSFAASAGLPPRVS
jgi:hypothetical protein